MTPPQTRKRRIPTHFWLHLSRLSGCPRRCKPSFMDAAAQLRYATHPFARKHRQPDLVVFSRISVDKDAAQCTPAGCVQCSDIQVPSTGAPAEPAAGGTMCLRTDAGAIGTPRVARHTIASGMAAHALFHGFNTSGSPRTAATPTLLLGATRTSHHQAPGHTDTDGRLMWLQCHPACRLSFHQPSSLSPSSPSPSSSQLGWLRLHPASGFRLAAVAPR